MRFRPGWIGYGLGGLLIAYGLYGLVTAGADVRFPGWALWFAGAAVADDLAVVPVLLVAGVLTCLVPLPYRRIVRAALVVGGALTLVALPVVLGFGRNPRNLSVLPQPYGRNLLLLLAIDAVLAAAAVAVVAARRFRGRARPMRSGE